MLPRRSDQKKLGWGASGLASLTLLNKRVFDIPHYKIHEWRLGKDRKGILGSGRILWIKARTLTGKTINIVTVVYQATSDNAELQKRIYEALPPWPIQHSLTS